MTTRLSPEVGVSLSQNVRALRDAQSPHTRRGLHSRANIGAEVLPDSRGDGVKAYAYDAFGTALNFSPNTAGTHWLFGGDGLWDPNSLFTYHLARFRDGDRFISYDSYEADPTTPAALHKYLYAGASPVCAWDPSGLSPFADVLVTMGVMSILIGMFAWEAGALMHHHSGTLGQKLMGIYIERGGRAMMGWGLPVNWLTGNAGSTYELNDDQHELSENAVVRQNMHEFYSSYLQAYIASGGSIPTDAYVRVPIPRQNAAAYATGRLFNTGYAPYPWDYRMWLTRSAQVMVEGSVEARRFGNMIVYGNPDTHWEWIDEVDAHSFLENPRSTLENLVDLAGDKVLDANFGVTIRFEDWDAGWHTFVLP